MMHGAPQIIRDYDIELVTCPMITPLPFTMVSTELFPHCQTVLAHHDVVAPLMSIIRESRHHQSLTQFGCISASPSRHWHIFCASTSSVVGCSSFNLVHLYWHVFVQSKVFNPSILRFHSNRLEHLHFGRLLMTQMSIYRPT